MQQFMSEWSLTLSLHFFYLVHATYGSDIFQLFMKFFKHPQV